MPAIASSRGALLRHASSTRSLLLGFWVLASVQAADWSERKGHCDLGAIALGDVVECVLSVRGDSSQALRIAHVGATSDWLEAQALTADLEPGADAAIQVRIRPRHLGTFFQAVEVRLEDGRVWTVSVAGRCDAPTPQQVDTMTIAATDLLLGVQGPARLVDVRRPETFRRGHIAGSLNIPGRGLLTKAFLRKQSLLLVNEGHGDVELRALCEELAYAGFDSVRILRGGIRAWRNEGGMLAGEDVESSAVNGIEPAQFQFTRDAGPWMVFAPEAQAAEARRLLGLEILQLPAGREIQTIAQATQAAPEVEHYLVAASEGDAAIAGEAAAFGAPERLGFHLVGGLAAYARFLDHATATLNRGRTVTLTSDSGGDLGPGTTTGRRPEPGGCCGGR